MTKRIAIYVEGGGDTAQTLAPFRTGMAAFLKPILDVARSRRILGGVIPCGGRQRAYDAFCDAMENEPDVLNVLLVDSEEPADILVSPWTHLHNRKGDGWVQPAGVDDSRCHMMVVCMEAWFLADPQGLKRHYRKNFDLDALPDVAYVETREKDQIAKALKQATRATAAGEYRKIRDGAKLLAIIDPATVRNHCKWCDRLFLDLGKAIGAGV